MKQLILLTFLVALLFLESQGHSFDKKTTKVSMLFKIEEVMKSFTFNETP